jgi:adenine-specific DNA-methyltransferase
MVDHYALCGTHENSEYLAKQIITYIGNKRKLLPFIESSILAVKKELNADKLTFLDMFSGTGIVSRLFKKHASLIIANDLEDYSCCTDKCYLSNKNEINLKVLSEIQKMVLDSPVIYDGLFSTLYAPIDDDDIKIGERVFYTRKNAVFLDTVRTALETVPKSLRNYFIAPLLAEASIHTNTSGIFKGFHKKDGVGHFGGAGENSLTRIKGNIHLNLPILSNFHCDHLVFQRDANELNTDQSDVDFAYFDPPYNQHPYGSNYFMLNLLVNNKFPTDISEVSGIPKNWNHSNYNKKSMIKPLLFDLIDKCKAKFILISYSSDGFIDEESIDLFLAKQGVVTKQIIDYNTFRGCRNLANRNIRISEFLYLLKK